MSPRSERDWRLYADDIVSACTKIRRFVAGMTYEAFVVDERTQDAVIRNPKVAGSNRPPQLASSTTWPLAKGGHVRCQRPVGLVDLLAAVLHDVGSMSHDIGAWGRIDEPLPRRGVSA